MKKPEETIRTATADIIYALLHIDKGNLDKAYAILESVVSAETLFTKKSPKTKIARNKKLKVSILLFIIFLF